MKHAIADRGCRVLGRCLRMEVWGMRPVPQAHRQRPAIKIKREIFD